MLATERNDSGSTHNQARRAILFLDRQAHAVQLPWLENRSVWGTGGAFPVV